MTDVLGAAEPATGDLLGGRYHLTERVGAGAMGRVYRARDEVLGRDVAIKLFHAEDASEADAARKVSEARVLAALDHPSLVTLYDAHVVPGESAFLVMEYVEGTTLRHRLDAGPVPPLETARMMRDLAAALAVVHGAGIVHRDVKPSNVLLREGEVGPSRSRVVLADFGVAHLIDSTRLTSPGTVIGTAAYLAPEQVRGEAPQPASDVYALGLLVIEALTGLHPFGGGSLQATVLARLARSPEVPDELEERWAALLRAMTALDPQTRPSAAEVAERAATLGNPGGLRRAARSESPVVLAETQALGLADLNTEPAAVPDEDAGTGDDHDERMLTRRRLLWLGAGALAAVLIAVLLVVGLVTAMAAEPATGEPTPAGDPGPVITPGAILNFPVDPADPAEGTTPADTTPADTTPADTTPADTTPADTTPADTAPADTTAVSDTAPQGGTGNANPNAGPGNNNGNGNGPGQNNGNGNGNGGRDR